MDRKEPALQWRIELGEWERQKIHAQPVRLAVFVQEQKVPLEMEWDEHDETSVHAVAWDASGTALATGRLLADGHIGRMAVLPAARGIGLGSAILASLMLEARRRGLASVLLHAQKQAEAFYARHGFLAEGETFLEAGILHVLMRCSFPQSA